MTKRSMERGPTASSLSLWPTTCPGHSGRPVLVSERRLTNAGQFIDGSDASGANPPTLGILLAPVDRLGARNGPGISAGRPSSESAGSVRSSAARRSRYDRGDRTASLIASRGGRSGKTFLASCSRRLRQPWRSRHNPPICAATFGSLSGPTTTIATRRITRSFSGENRNTFSSQLVWASM